MKRCFFCIAIALCVFSGNVLNAGGLDMKQIPASARWLLHIDVEKLLDSGLGDIVRKFVELPEVRIKLEKLEAAASFDLLRDVRDITVWGGEKPEKTAVVLIKGYFNKDRFIAIISAAGGFEAIDYGFHKFYSWVDKNNGKLQYGGFVDDGTVFISPNKDAVTDFLDTVDGASESGSFGLQNKGKEGCVAIALVNGLGKIQGVSRHASILKDVGNICLEIRDAGKNLGGKLVLEAIKENASEQVKGMVYGIKALIEMSLADKPVYKELVEKVEIKSAGKQVEADFSCPVSIIKDAFEKQQQSLLSM